MRCASRSRPGGRPGMSLLELVVGLTITGVVFAAGYAAVASIADHRQRVDQATRELARAATVRHTLASWLSGARLMAEQDGPDFRGFDGDHRGLPDAELTFLTTAVTPLGVGHTIVRLYVDRSDGTPETGLVAELVEWRGAARTRLEVEPRATGMSLRYLTGVSGDRRWLPSWISSSVLPLGVELALVSDAADPLPPLLELPILVALGGGR
jgi:prepilin-type N-terminal cleavage/methylation domain-containing protein